MKNLNNIKSVLASKGVNAVCCTADGSIFHMKDISFADAHSQRFKNKSVEIFGKDESFIEENENLFFEGSRYSFQVVEIKSDSKDEDDNQGNDNDNDNEGSGEAANDEMSVKMLKSKAKLIEGYKSAMNKAELIELINA